MSRILRAACSAFVIAGLVGVTIPASAGETELQNAQPRSVQLAFHDGAQTANLPVGTVSLRVIDGVGGSVVNGPIKWRVMTYGRDANGDRHLAAEAKGASPRLTLPAAWYIVHAQLPDRVVKHPIEVSAGRTYKYTLVKK